MSAPHTPPRRFAAAVEALPPDSSSSSNGQQLDSSTAAYKHQPALFAQFKNARIAAAAGQLHGRFASSLISLAQFDQFHREKDRAIREDEQSRRAMEMQAAREEAQNRRMETSVLKARVNEPTASLFGHSLQPQQRSHAGSGASTPAYPPAARGLFERGSAASSLVVSPVASPPRIRAASSLNSSYASHTLPAAAAASQQPVGYAIHISSAGTAILQHPPQEEEEKQQPDHLPAQRTDESMPGLQWLQMRDQRVQQQQQRQLEAEAQSRAAAAAAAALDARVFGHASSSTVTAAPSHASVVSHTRSRVRNLRTAMDSIGLDESSKRATRASPQNSPRGAHRAESTQASKSIALRRSPLEPRSPPSPAAAAPLSQPHSHSQVPIIASARRPMSAAKRAAERKAKELPSHVARLLQIQSEHTSKHSDSEEDSDEDAKSVATVRRRSTLPAAAAAAKSSVRIPASPSRAPALSIRNFHAASKPSLSADIADADLPLERPRSSLAAARVPINQLAARALANEEDDDLNSTALTSRWAAPAPYPTAAVESYEQLPRPSLALPVPLPQSPIHIHVHPVPPQPQPAISMAPSRSSSPPMSNASSRLASRRSSVVSAATYAALAPVPSAVQNDVASLLQPQHPDPWGDYHPAPSAEDAAADAELTELDELLHSANDFDASLHSIAQPTGGASSSAFSYTAPLYASKPASSFSGASTVVIVPQARRPPPPPQTQGQRYMDFLRRQNGQASNGGGNSTARSIPAHSFFQPSEEMKPANAAAPSNGPLVRYAPVLQTQLRALQNGTDLHSGPNQPVHPADSNWSASLRSEPTSPSASIVAHRSASPTHTDGSHHQHQQQHVSHLADTSLMSPARLAAYLRHYLQHRVTREEENEHDNGPHASHSHMDVAHSKLHLTEQDESQLQRVLVQLDSIRSAQDFGSANGNGAHVLTTRMDASLHAPSSIAHAVSLPPKSSPKKQKPLPQFIPPQRKKEEDIAARIAATHRRVAARGRRMAAAEDERLAMALLHIAADKAAEGDFKRSHALQLLNSYSQVHTPLETGKSKKLAAAAAAKPSASSAIRGGKAKAVIAARR